MPYPSHEPVTHYGRIREATAVEHASMSQNSASADITMEILGGRMQGDGAGGLFRWDAASTLADDGGLVIKPAIVGAGPGRWRRIYNGPISVQWYGARGDDNADDTVQIQTAIDAAAGYGRELFFPPGVYLTTAPIVFRRSPAGVSPFPETALIGAGRSSSIIRGSFLGAMLTWESGTTAACVRLQNLTIDQTTVGGTCLKWLTNNQDVDRLQLALDHVDFNYYGSAGTSASPDVYCVDISGGLKCNFVDVNINGGAKAPSTWVGWGLKLTGCSQCTFVSLFFANGSVGRGLWVEGGGNNIFLHTRVDAGSRNGGPGYYFHNTTRSSVTGIRGEGSDDTPFLKIEGCTAMTFLDAGVPNNGYSGPNGDMVQILGCVGVNFIGGCIADQAGSGGTGTGLRIDAASNFIKFDRVMMAHAAENITIADRTRDIALDILDNLNDYVQPQRRLTFGGQDSGADWTKMLTASSALWDPPSLAYLASTTTTVTVLGAVVGNLVGVRWRPNQTWYPGTGSSWLLLPWQMLITGAVTANDTVTVTLYNNTGLTNDMVAGFADVTVWQRG